MNPRSPLAVVATLAASITLAGQLTAATYEQNFDGFADGTIDLGDGSVMAGTATIIGERLELTRDGVAGGFASFSIPALADSTLGWVATFDLEISDGVGDNEPADGLSFNYGNAALGELGSAEEGMAGVGTVTENISFEIDTWMNLDAEQGVNIAEKVGGVDTNLAFTNGSILADGTAVSGQVVVEFNPAEGLSFTTTGLLTNADFSDVVTSFAGNEAYNFIISARVGGANQTVLIDNLVITTGSPDSDGDGLPDSWEQLYDLDPNDNGENPNNNGEVGDPDQGADGDPDMDTLTNAQEFARGTFPNTDDSDMDGFTDNVEDGGGVFVSAMETGTNPRNPDSDGDLYLDGVEDNSGTYVDEDNTGTDPNNPDTDGDELPDGSEVGVGRNPTVFDPPAPSTRYVQSFDGYPNGATVLGDGTMMNGTAKIQDGQLELTRDGVAGGFASFVVPGLPKSDTGWTATFDLTISDGAGAEQPADGMSFNYGNFELNQLGGAEEGMHGNGQGGAITENLSFEIDTWMNVDAEQGVNIAEFIGGVDTDLAFTNGSILSDGTSVSGPVVIVYNPVDGVSFTTEGLLTNAAFENVATSFIGDEAFNFGFSARVGGANQTVLIDNLEIQVGVAADNFRILSIEKVIVPGAGGNPDTISVTVTWTSEEGGAYGVYASPDLPADIFDWEELDDSVPGEVGAEQTSFTEMGIPIGTERRFYQVRDNSNR